MYEKLQPYKAAYDQKGLITQNLSDFEELYKGSSSSFLKESDLNVPWNDRVPVLIVAPGPSAREGLRERVEQHKEKGGAVYLVGGASMFLNKGADGENAVLSRDLVDGVIHSDPNSDPASLIKEDSDLKDVPVYFTTHSAAHVLEEKKGVEGKITRHDLPNFYERMEAVGAIARPYHAHTDGVHEPDGRSGAVLGYGHGAVMSGIALVSALGHRDIETIGWDGYPEYAISIDDTPNYKEAVETDHVILDINGKKTAVFGPFAGDPTEFVQFVTHYSGAIHSLHVHGGGAVAQILTPDDQPRCDFSNVRIGNDDLAHKNSPEKTAENGAFELPENNF